jgi:hypothetical protein
MKDQTSIACPVKRTNVFRWVCAEKCGRTQDQCAAARLAMQAETKACVVCRDFANELRCEPCMDADGQGRERPAWNPNQIEKRAELIQMSLF